MQELNFAVSQDNKKSQEGKISFKCDIPSNLQKAMNEFIEQRPNWDQYNIIQAAIAEFLMDKSPNSRDLMRLYKSITFDRKKLNNNI